MTAIRMTEHQEAIREGFDRLRALCDPRGHALLDALENVCIIESVGLDSVVAVVDQTPAVRANVIPLIREWSVKAS